MNNNSKIIGLSFDYHNSAAALIIDGEVVAAAQEERFSRKKNDAKFPKQAIEYCLSQADLSRSDMDQIVFYEDPMVKFDRIVKTALHQFPRNINHAEAALSVWFTEGKFDAVERICEHFSVLRDKVLTTDHHEAHAAS